jgi:monofunctional biosynthetic peptidoglycan transglycosylase
MRPPRIRRLLLQTLVLALALAVVVAGGYAARIAYLRSHNPTTTAFMTQRLALLQAVDAQARLAHTWVPYARIAPALKRAVIAAEDAKFADHAGFDWEGIEAALKKNLRRGEVVAGGSTISQQLAKNLFLSGRRSLWRKGQEAVLTVMLEAILPKRRILEIYLNVIEWGSGIYGVEAASRHYFRRSAASLDPHQASLLAAMVPRPRLYHRRGFTPVLQQRAALIRGRMESVRLP